MKHTVVVTGLGLMLALGACGGQAHQQAAPTTTTAPPTYTITGSLVLEGTLFSLDNTDTISYQRGGACWGTNGYDDVKEGAQVTVENENGATIGTSALDAGQLAEDPAKMRDPTAKTTCSFSFVVRDVPKARFYKVEVSHRGQVTYSFDQLVNNSWSAELSLGS